MPESPQLGSNRPAIRASHGAIQASHGAIRASHGAIQASHGAIRPDIQALRALAILSVVVYHLWPQAAPGGFVGVDIFFVISGYLITGQLWRQARDEGRVRFAQFWARRARRLLPVSLLVILLTTLAAWFLLPATRSVRIFDEASASATYWQNWLLMAKATDYLQQDLSGLSPFQHFWSLSVEEQYYLVWPLLVGLVLWVGSRFKNSMKSRAWLASSLLAVIVVSSLFASIWLTAADAPLAYFSTFTRAWEFAIGALLAVAIDDALLKAKQPKDRNPVWFWFGSVLMLSGIFLFSDTTPFPSFWAAVPTVGAALALYGGQSGNRFLPRFLIELRATQFFGDISYSLYLWHWPLVVLVPLWLGNANQAIIALAILVASIAIAAASKRYVEDPVRFGWLARRSNLVQLVLALAAMFAVMVPSVLLEANTKTRLAQNAASTNLRPALADLDGDISHAEKSKCFVSKVDDAFTACSYGDLKGQTSVALLGDSHMRQYFTPLEAIAKKHHFKLTLLSKSACPPLSTEVSVAGLPEPSCVQWQQSLDSYLKSVKPFDLIIEASSSYVTSQVKNIGPSFERLVKSQQARGSSWLVIRDNPKPRADTTDCIEAHPSTADKVCSTPRKAALKPVDKIWQKAKELKGVVIADFTDLYCSQSCSGVIGDIIVYRDQSHLTNTFAATLQSNFEAIIAKEFLK
ncbi:MAG: hypothetical protein RL196_481 [Actinomycetota bacterium]|jgi:peptidoglycan/LPS O-acetylase OafA/YrhL